jgi:hypothetical protein
MADLDSKIRHVQSLLNVTTARGATPGEADNAQRLAQRLIDRHGLHEHFNRKPVIVTFVDVDPSETSAERFWNALRRAGLSEEELDMLRGRSRSWAAETAYEDFQKAANEIREDIRKARAARERLHKTRHQRRKENRLKEYKGANGTARAVAAIGRGKPVTKEQLAEWYGGLSVDAAHGRLWRAAMAGLLKKVKGGYVVA